MYKGKVVVVTGSSSGIGAGIALQYAGEGARVTLTGRSQDQLLKVKQQCIQQANAAEHDILTVQSDLNEGEAACKTIIDETLSNFGAIDVLVCNAGIAYVTVLGMTPFASLDTTLNVNLKAHFILAQLALPHLKATKGNIITVSSVYGSKVPENPGLCVYSCTKAAIEHITRCWAMELAPFGIRVNCLAPGLVVTDIYRNLPAAVTEKFIEEAIKANPIEGVVTPEDCGKTCLFLSSEDAKYITGAVLHVDAGLRLASMAEVTVED